MNLGRLTPRRFKMDTESLKCRVRLDSTALMKAYSDLQLEFERTERLLELLPLSFHGFNILSELGNVKSRSATFGADLTIFLEPSDLFCEFLAACRAINT